MPTEGRPVGIYTVAFYTYRGASCIYGGDPYAYIGASYNHKGAPCTYRGPPLY